LDLIYCHKTKGKWKIPKNAQKAVLLEDVVCDGKESRGCGRLFVSGRKHGSKA